MQSNRNIKYNNIDLKLSWDLMIFIDILVWVSCLQIFSPMMAVSAGIQDFTVKLIALEITCMSSYPLNAAHRFI